MQQIQARNSTLVLFVLPLSKSFVLMTFFLDFHVRKLKIMQNDVQKAV